MSIAVTAPEKFDLQDIVCVEIMLRFASRDGATFLVEPQGGEDGELQLSAGSVLSRLEIQVKGAAGPVTLSAIASCLAHTPPKCADHTLLERLLDDPERMVVLVMSGRSDDASSIYVVGRDWVGQSHAPNRIGLAQAKALVTAFATADVAGADGGKLNTKRRAHNATIAKAIDVKAVRDALCRLVIIEQVDEAELEARCTERLGRDFGIPTERAPSVVRELRAVVKRAKSDGIDAYPLARSVLSTAAPPPIRPDCYVYRGLENGFQDVLSRENVLLLSGTPRVGKSFVARWIAAEFRQHGYDVQEFRDVDGAERFLLDPGSTPRLAVLDDPLGGSHILPEAARSLARLTQLTTRVRPQRKLIVAQGLEPLLATARVPSLDAAVIASHRWEDLGALAPSFLVDVWRSLAAAYGIDNTLRDLVTDALTSARLKLEPGCLEHLAANRHRLQATPSIADVARLAREDATQLGLALVADGLDGLALSLALTTAAQEPISTHELAFARGEGGTSLPGKAPKGAKTITFGGPAHAPAPPPSYEQTPELSASDRDGLDALERRRLIEVDQEPSVGFTHPFYRAAAETLLKAPTYHLAQSANGIVERGLFCLSPRTSRATARNLDWVFDRLQSRQDARMQLVERAIAGLRSYFPATRDLCFGFLVRRLAELPSERANDLPRWISFVTSIGLDDLEWVDGQAHLPFGERAGIDYVERMLRTVRRREVSAELALLETSDEFVTPERAAKALKYLASKPAEMTPVMVGRLLSYDEAALRAEAIKLWLSEVRTADESILERIFADDHPSCAVAALKGTIRGWSECGDTRRNRLLDGLATVAADVAAAAALLDGLVVFDRVEFTGKDPPWAIFERLQPIVMNALPHNAAFNDARLFAVARSALEALPTESMLAFCDGWIGWLERNECEGQLPSEFSLGVAEILLSATRERPELRGQRVTRLLAFAGTGAAITFVADLIDDWDLLRPDERKAVLDRLTSGRSDDRWLQAVALTRSVIPKGLAKALLPPNVKLSQSGDELLASMAPNLLQAAVHVYSGHPQPLWWLGSHHSGKAVWEPVVEAIARSPNHPLFQLAWEHIASKGEGARVAKLVEDVGAPGADRVLDILMSGDN
jgi:hypothetical protein